MRICDLTMAYNTSSGGIRTYIDNKRRHILEHTEHEHVLIIPGSEDSVVRDGRAETRTIKSPKTGHGDYRLLWRPDEIFQALVDAEPDIVELATFFVCPWPAFSYRSRTAKEGRRTPVFGYFHTDIADAYVESPVTDLTHDLFEPWSHTLADLGGRFAEFIGGGATSYFGAVFKRCDRMLASSPDQVERLKHYSIDSASVIPMGVDLETFNPAARDESLRRSVGATPDTLVLAYAGRLDDEKHVDVLVDAFETLRESRPAVLLLVGEGPKRDELESRAETLRGLRLLGYVSDKPELARILASADVYLSAGPHETFGISIIEAQACGLPVVGVEAGALVDRVEPALGFLGPVDDPRAMARNIERAADERESMGPAARRHVEERFGWTPTFRGLIELYKASLAEPLYAEGGGGRSGPSRPPA